MTQIFKTISLWQEHRKSESFCNKTIGFVATMGHLHQGHESLLKQSLKQNDITVLSIFVNPTQFNKPDDFKDYPRTYDADSQITQKAGADYIFMPDHKSLYPDNYSYHVSENHFSKILEGQYRRGHFEGVLTVVLKLLMLVNPTHAYFGEKDYQQLQLIKGMCRAFFLDTKIVACPTIRDVNGLALSSRNARFSQKQYQSSIHFPRLLQSNQFSCKEIALKLTKLGFTVDYIEEKDNRRFGAVTLGDIRLIDNYEL